MLASCEKAPDVIEHGPIRQRFLGSVGAKIARELQDLGDGSFQQDLAAAVWSAASLSESERIGVRDADRAMLRSQGTNCVSLVEPQERVELLRQRSFRVVALQLGDRAVDNADETFQARLEQATAKASGFVHCAFSEVAALMRDVRCWGKTGSARRRGEATQLNP